MKIPQGSIKSRMKDFIVRTYLGRKDAPLGDGDSFLGEGIIDSIGVIELVAFIQETYNIKIAVPEIIPANLDTLDNLERFIIRKLSGL
jgi:acyl carrier protein